MNASTAGSSGQIVVADAGHAEMHVAIGLTASHARPPPDDAAQVTARDAWCITGLLSTAARALSRPRRRWCDRMPETG